MTSDSNTMRAKRVTFTPYVEVSEFPRLDSQFKSSLYYSKAEISEIQSRLRLAVAIRKQRRLLEQLASELIWNPYTQEQHDASIQRIKRQRFFSDFFPEDDKNTNLCCSGVHGSSFSNKKARLST
jgi:hypothetical protein